MYAHLSIVHLISSLNGGGTERSAFELALAQRESGHRVIVVPLSSAKALNDKSGLEEERIAILRAAGVEVRILGHWRRRMVLPAAFSLNRLIAESKPDIVHSHLMTGLALLRLSGCRVPAVGTHPNTPLPAGRLLCGVVTGRARAYTVKNASATQVLQGVFRGPITLIHNGIQHCVLPHVPKRADEPLRIISVGNMRRQKNYLQVVDIAAGLRARGVRACFRIVGDGPERKAVEAQVAALGLEDEIVLLGARRDVHKLLALSDIYLLTSLYEGMSVALMEAMQAGLPAVASDVGFCSEALTGPDGYAGFIVPIGDTETFVDRLERLAADADLRAAMGRRARERMKPYTVAAAAESYEAVYRRVLEETDSLLPQQDMETHARA